jgi:hypothetical protein
LSDVTDYKIYTKFLNGSKLSPYKTEYTQQKNKQTNKINTGVKLSHTLKDLSFIFGLFNDTVSILNYIASNGRMISK